MILYESFCACLRQFLNSGILFINKRILNIREKELKVKTEELNMDTNFEEVKMRIFSDRYGLLTVGTKREKMENMENSLFCHPLRRFDRTDKNKNGVIDADELLSRIKKEKAGDIALSAFEAVVTAACGIFAGRYFKHTKLIMASFWTALGTLNVIGASACLSRLPEENREISMLKEYIKLMGTEDSAM